MTDKNSLMRQLPKVDEMIRMIQSEFNTELPEVPTILIKHVVQKEIDSARQRILSEEPFHFSQNKLLERVKAEIQKQNKPHLQKVINATGIILHTNLGRAKLSKKVSEMLTEIGGHYSNLEYDLESGERGSRYSHVEELLTFLTGAESALVVNNNAAAVYLVLDSIGKGKEVIVSRGELVEIGGSFRVPEIMKASGCKLVEVGTTNKTHKSDYEDNIGEETGALLKVHTSNYKIIGFTEEVSLQEMKTIAENHSIPVICDLGSGLLLDLKAYGINSEPTVKECLKERADIICFSGDKLLGGPQAGIIVGDSKYINKMKKNHLLRALRIDKLTLTALELTLRQYLSFQEASEQIPTLKMITESPESLKERAETLHALLNKKENIEYEIVQTESQIGGGSMPGVNLPSYAIAVNTPHITADKLEQKLRTNTVPIITRIIKNRIFLDLRTIDNEDFTQIANFFNKIF